MTVKLLTEQHLEFLGLKGGCTGSSESTLVKMPHCWKSHDTAHLYFNNENITYWEGHDEMLLISTYIVSFIGRIRKLEMSGDM